MASGRRLQEHLRLIGNSGTLAWKSSPDGLVNFVMGAEINMVSNMEAKEKM